MQKQSRRKGGRKRKREKAEEKIEGIEKREEREWRLRLKGCRMNLA
ncbi:MAG: hypothetical protein IKI67_01075 [Bacteroidales bacterium]|nr:hypothetical protein [Bacteroidales bacterium]